MNISIKWNKIDTYWWLDLGISYSREYSNSQETPIDPEVYTSVVAVSFVVFSIYIHF